MYKLSEIAKKFNLERTILIEALIDNKLLLEGHTAKKLGITYVDDRGIEILYKLLLKKQNFLSEKISDENKNVLDEYKDLNEIEIKIKNDIYKMKEKIFALDTEIQKKNEFLIDYQEKLLNVNKLIVKYEENLLIDDL